MVGTFEVLGKERKGMEIKGEENEIVRTNEVLDKGREKNAGRKNTYKVKKIK